jgi:hypothetical protein
MCLTVTDKVVKYTVQIVSPECLTGGGCLLHLASYFIDETGIFPISEKAKHRVL